MLILALLTTALGHSIFVHTLKYFKVSTATIMTSALPIYGIIIAFLFLGEEPKSNVYIGGLLILSTVFIEGMTSPVGISLDANKNIYVNNCGTNKIIRVDQEGVHSDFCTDSLLNCPNG